MIGKKKKSRYLVAACFVTLLMMQSSLSAFTLTVQEPNGAPVGGYRWLIEEDTTNYTDPGVPVADSISLDIHNSYAPVVLNGRSATSVADINVPSDKRYFLSVLPDAGHAMGGAPVDVNQTTVTVNVHPQPIPTAQISILAFVDHGSINNVYDAGEQGLGGATIVIAELGGQQMTDAFGNMLGTTYMRNPDGSFVLDPDGQPQIEMMGTGYVTTLTQEDFDADINPYNLKVGEALVKNIAPGKYGVIVIPPPLDDDGNAIEWSQTSTIEGTPTVDAWVKANEPQLFVEGFGTGFNHCFFGFVKAAPTTNSPFKGQTFAAPAWNVANPGGTGTVTGRLRLNHFSRPPMTQGFWPGDIIGEGWVGLNDPASGEGLYAAACNEDGTFSINNVPAGTYELVTWDTPLDNLFGFHTVTVAEGETVDLGDILEYRWFGTFEGTVFLDDGGGDPNKANNGFPDPGEPGILEQNVVIRFRDGTIYQEQPTDTAGGFALEEVFPFFKWLVIEVDFARFKATGMTAVVDGGGQVQPHDGWNMPSYDKLNPQPQVDANGIAVINPNTGNNLSRTETGEVLTQAMHLFLNQTNVVHFGKNMYVGDENGGISGIVYYATTRAENDPRYAAGEPWEPGIPRVQVNLYMDSNPKDGVIDDIDSNAGPTLADVDNYPFGWRDDPNLLGAEDVDRNSNGNFDAGDAIQIVITDSWDDNKPTGSIGPDLTIHGQQVPVGMDQFATWNQVRPGVFDGGYAFGSYVPGGVDTGAGEVDGLPTGTYIVEAATPPGYKLLKEEDKNVDFGDEYTPSPQLLPPICVGDPHLVPQYLSFQTDDAGVPLPGIDPADLIEAPYAGTTRPLADRKQVILSPGKNAAADFFFFTPVPKAARGVGFVNNDLGAEFNQWSPNFGEKIAPKWIPIALRDWTGEEFHRIYCDEFGCYNFALHSTFSINLPAPSGVAPHMMTLVLNDPIMPDGSIDPFYNPVYSITPWTFQYYPATTSYLDTPLVPLSAFSTANLLIDTEPNETPVIYSLDGPGGAGTGPVIDEGAGGVITLQSKGMTTVLNPAYDSNVPGSPFQVNRNYGFGTIEGQVLLDGSPLIVNSWSDSTIEAVVPSDAVTGRVTVVRGDNGTATDVGVTLHVVDIATANIHYVDDDGGMDYTTIQAAIDANSTLPGDLVLVAPGVYNENVIMYKPLRLQGFGSGGTIIFGYPNPAEKLTEWHNRINALGPSGYIKANLTDAFGANEAPAIIVIGEVNDGGVVINPGLPFGTPGQAMIDGFTCSGSKAGGGIYAPMGAGYLTISNNNVTGNQGNSGGGIIIGFTNPNFDVANTNVAIRWNKVHKNGGVQGPAGIALHAYSTSYSVEGNLIWGNFSRFNGGGIGHLGLCLGDNVIRYNTIIYNEDFFGVLLNQAGDGAGIYIGGAAAGGAGTGNVTINANLIQGNMTGSGYGGGIRAFAVNGQDVAASPNDPNNWYVLNVFNNIIVNNVAALGGAGISLQDVARARIVNNTVANNDSTATAALAFIAGQLNSTPQPSGILGAPHSDALVAMFGPSVTQTYSNPLLQNNIVWHNRSWYNDASLNGGQGGLAPRPGSPYWDLAVLGSTALADPHLTPTNCLLTDQIDPATGFDYGAATNVYADPMLAGAYENTLQSAAVLDEGGNFISVLIEPLTIQGSNYHITGGSPAILAGDGAVVNDFTELAFDYDTDPRFPTGTDIGADQLTDTAPNGAPVITSVTATPGAIFETQTSQLQGTATDGDGPSPLSYNWIVPPGGGSVSDPTIANPVYTPPDVAALTVFTLTVEVSDGADMTVDTVDVTVNDAMASIIYEAEDAALSGPVVSSAIGGYTGTGFVDYINASTDYIEWTVDAPADGLYTLQFRYALGIGNRPLAIRVNGAVVDTSLDFPSTGGWTTWGTTSVTANLNMGANTVRATAIGFSGGNVDHLEVTLLEEGASILEAEDAVLSGAVVASTIAGFTGTGFVDYVSASADYIEWTANVPVAGLYNLEFRYALGNGDRPLEIRVNGAVVAASQSFPNTGGWGTWGTVSTLATMNAGANTIRATAIGASGANVDHVKVTRVMAGAAIYEAELATLSGAVVSSALGGYTGTGFVDYVNASGDYTEWTVNAPAAGSYELQFRYALGAGDRPLQIQVNGGIVVPSLSFPATGGWMTWGTVSTIQTLNAGANTVRATAIGSSGGNVDHLNVISQ